ncbi:MAG: N-formylglutamate amidohydrolase, partial [Myxococcota bacterium]
SDVDPALVIEIPHGATEEADFTQLAAQLEGPHPEGLVEFFHVNTDVGAPELGQALGRQWMIRRPTEAVLILRCRVPRTFLDCNRQWGAEAVELEDSALSGRSVTGRVTPGMMPWVTSPADQALLFERYRAYQDAVEATRDRLLPQALLLQLHSYAPRSLDVAVDLDIVTSLRAAYRPERVETWPLRPPLDLIHRLPDGRSLAPEGLIEALKTAFEGVETVADGATYPLHPATTAHAHAQRYPSRVACLEVRRDLLTSEFVPLRPVRIDAARVERIAAPLAAALGALFGDR